MTDLPLLPEEDEIVAGLGERGLPEWGARVVAPQIVALPPPLREAFLAWWQSGEVPDVSVQGQSLQRLVAGGLTPLAALLSLDALERDPVAVKARLNRGREGFIPVQFNEVVPADSSGETS